MCTDFPCADPLQRGEAEPVQKHVPEEVSTVSLRGITGTNTAGSGSTLKWYFPVILHSAIVLYYIYFISLMSVWNLSIVVTMGQYNQRSDGGMGCMELCHLEIEPNGCNKKVAALHGDHYTQIRLYCYKARPSFAS